MYLKIYALASQNEFIYRASADWLCPSWRIWKVLCQLKLCLWVNYWNGHQACVHLKEFFIWNPSIDSHRIFGLSMWSGCFRFLFLRFKTYRCELLQVKGSNFEAYANETMDPSLCWRVKTSKLVFNYLAIYLSYPYFQAVLYTCMRCPLNRRVEYRASCHNQFWKQCGLVGGFMDFILQPYWL